MISASLYFFRVAAVKHVEIHKNSKLSSLLTCIEIDNRLDKTFRKRFPTHAKIIGYYRFPLISIRTQKFCHCFLPIHSVPS